MNKNKAHQISLKSIKSPVKQNRYAKTIWSTEKPPGMSNAMYKALILVKEFMSQSNKAQIFLKEGKLAMEENDYNGAIECFNEGISCNPSVVSFYTYRAVCHNKQNLFKLAYFDYSFAIRLEPNHGSHYCFRGLCLAKLKKFDMALEDLDISCQLDPSPFHFYSRGTVLADSLKYEDSIKDFSKAIELEIANNPLLTELRLKCLYRRAQSFLDINSCKEAIEDLNVVLSGDSTSLNALLMLARAHKLLCEYKKAEECISNSILLDPSQPTFFAERGDIRYRTGRHNQIIEAIYDFDKAIALYQKKISSLISYYDNNTLKMQQPRNHRNSITFNIGNQTLPTINTTSNNVNIDLITPKGNDSIKSNRDYYDKIYGLQDIEENLADVFNKRAQAKLLLDTNITLIEEALEDSLKALTIEPKDLNYSLVLSTCYIRLNQFEKAMEIIQEVLSQSPKNERALYQYSFCLREIGQKRDAIEELTKIIAFVDKGLINSVAIPMHRIYETRGALFHEIQANKLALADIGKAVTLNPDRPENLYLRADCHAKLGNYEQAINDYNYAESKKFPDLYTLYTSRGTVHRLRGRSDEAIIDFDKALDILKSEDNKVSDPLNIQSIRLYLLQSLCMIDQQMYKNAYDILTISRDLVVKAVVVMTSDDLDSLSNITFDISSLKKLDWILTYHTALTTYMLKLYSESIELLTYCINNAYEADESGNESETISNNSIFSINDKKNRVTYCPDSYTFGIVTYFLGLSYYRMNDVSLLESSEMYYNMTYNTTWVNIASNKLLLLFSLGKLYQKLGNHIKAIEYFTDAINLDDKNAYIYFRRGWSYKAIKQYKLAGNDFEISKKVANNNPNFSIDYRNISSVEYIEIDDEPDFVEIFPVLLPIPGQF